MKMKRSSHAFFVCAFVAAIAVNVLCVCGQYPNGLEGTMEVPPPSPRRDFPAEVDIYKKPTPKPEHPLKKEFPELFTTEAIVVTFSADWCVACRRQAIELRGPSERFNILRVKIEEENEKGETVPSRWGRLMDRLELGESIPVTIVVAKGEVLKTFYNYTPWATIRPHAEKAKKNADETDNIDIGPINIDWDDGLNIDWRRNRRPPRP